MSRTSPTIYTPIYTETNPENIIPARKGSWFFRKRDKFYVNYDGNVDGKWITIPYKTVILPRPNPNKLIIYERPTVLWEKTTDGFLNEFEVLLPKTGWKFLSYKDVFIAKFIKNFGWIFPIPSSSYDPIGVDENKSYDENYFYLKTGGVWYRTPIALFEGPAFDIGELAGLYNSPPFSVIPRYLPVPNSSTDQLSAQTGEQTYDRDFFYIKPSNWKRTNLNVYSPFAMTIF
jgi:hypothetical protein